jgi:prepilin peptidase CpaA
MQTWELVLAAALGVSVFTDLTRGMIYNWVTVPAAVWGLVLWAEQMGWPGLWAWLWGVLLGGGILLLPFFLGGVGGGDVKLLAAAGALGGAAFALKTAVYACILGGVLALIVMAAKGRLQAGLGQVGRFFRGALVPGLKPESPKPLGLPGIPFAVCIAAGALGARFLDLWPRF